MGNKVTTVRNKDAVIRNKVAITRIYINWDIKLQLLKIKLQLWEQKSNAQNMNLISHTSKAHIISLFSPKWIDILVPEEENSLSYSSHSIKSQIRITCVLEWHREIWTTVPGAAGIAPAKSWRWKGPFVPWPCWTEKTKTNPQTCDLSYKCGNRTVPLFPQYYNFTDIDFETWFMFYHRVYWCSWYLHQRADSVFSYVYMSDTSLILGFASASNQVHDQTHVQLLHIG